MQQHKTYTALYDPVYLFNVPPRVFVREAFIVVALFLVLSFFLNSVMEMIFALGVSLIICIFGFFFVHSYISSRYKKFGYYWQEELDFYDEIPYKKIYKKGRAFLP